MKKSVVRCINGQQVVLTLEDLNRYSDYFSRYEIGELIDILQPYDPLAPLPAAASKSPREPIRDVNEFRWEVYTGRQELYYPKAAPLIHQDELLKRALHDSRGHPGTRVSDFKDWIHSLYGKDWRPEQKEVGKIVERLAERQVARPEMRTQNAPQSSEWELIHCDKLDGTSTVFEISSLSLGGKPMWGVPDLVFQHKQTKEVLIVERKASNVPVPRNGWPDLRAQLWAYGHIDVFSAAPRITLVAEIWSYKATAVGYQIGLSGALRWTHQSEPFHIANADLFNIYRTLPTRQA